jgi:hypothetical protein
MYGWRAIKMEELNIQVSCEIDNLIKVVAKRTNRSYFDVESEAFREGAYPEGSKTYVDVRWPSPTDGWFRKEVQAILKEKGLLGIYITLAI